MSESDRILTSIRTRCFEIARIDDSKRVSPQWHVQANRAVKRWLEAGCDPDLDIYPTIERLTSKASTPPGSLAYFVEAVREAHDRRMAGPRTPAGWDEAKYGPSLEQLESRRRTREIEREVDERINEQRYGKGWNDPKPQPRAPSEVAKPAARPSDDDAPPWERVNGAWPSDEQIDEAYPLARPYVQALRDRRKIGNWRAPSGETVIDRDPLPEDFLPPAESMRMRELGDPLKALSTRGSNDARQ